MFKIYKFNRFFLNQNLDRSRKKIMDFSNIINDKYIYWQKLRDKLIIHFFYLFFMDIYIWKKAYYLLIYNLFGFI